MGPLVYGKAAVKVYRAIGSGVSVTAIFLYLATKITILPP